MTFGFFSNLGLFALILVSFLVGVALILLIIFQRGEEGSFSRSSAHRHIKGTTDAMRKDTVLLSSIWLTLIVILNIFLLRMGR